MTKSSDERKRAPHPMSAAVSTDLYAWPLPPLPGRLARHCTVDNVGEASTKELRVRSNAFGLQGLGT
eukprot:scaffold142079_cov31-Tisochrysis_lutea.AAC.1